MLYENTMFSILENRKHKIVFDCQMCFSYFFCSGKHKTILEDNYQIDPYSLGRYY